MHSQWLYAFLLKTLIDLRPDRLSKGTALTAVARLASFTEIAVGISLLAIGGFGIHEAREWKLEEAQSSTSVVQASAQVRAKAAVIILYV